jgi:dCTP deaminase
VILTDREIKLAIQQKLIVIEPSPREDMAYSATAVDLTLDPHLSQFKEPVSGIETAIDPSAPDFQKEAEKVLAQISIPIEIGTEGYLLKPRKLVLGSTVEYVHLPVVHRIAARVEGKSSLARLGLGVHITAPTIHAGFPGRVRLEMMNHGPVPIRLRGGMRICQLIFEQTLGTPEKGYQGQFFDQASH